MRIQIAPRKTRLPDVAIGTILLQEDGWNDFSYHTLFQAYFRTTDELMELGNVKICAFNQDFYVPLGQSFGVTELDSGLGDNFCSLGQSAEYYEKISNLPRDQIATYLEYMRDCACDSSIYEKFKDIRVFSTSLMRFSGASEAMDKARSIIFEENLTVRRKFSISYAGAKFDSEPVVFDFEPHKKLPHRINVLVGSNGVGKTKLLSDLALAMSNYALNEDDSKYNKTFELDTRPSFYRLIALSFNAFDSFRIPQDSDKFRYFYKGLRDISSDTSPAAGDQPVALKSQHKIMDEIGNSVREISCDEKKKALFVNYCRRIFPSWLYDDDEEFYKPDIYKLLSAGQRVCLNIISGVVELIEDDTLILLDEPENHLHPMMMSTLINILFDLVHEQYDACAIIATHSPIVVQQVPRRYVRKLQREGTSRWVNEPRIETFGANLSEITSSIFEATEHERDYKHQFKRMLSECGNDISSVEADFGGDLAPDARILLRSLAAKTN